MNVQSKRGVLGSSFVVVLGLALGGQDAHAAEPVAGPPGAPAEDAQDEGRIVRKQKVLTGGVDVGVFADRQPTQDVVSISPLMRLGLRPRPEVELGISMGAATLTADSRQDGRIREVRPSNFVLGTRWVRDTLGDRHQGHLGFSFALPTNLHVGDREEETLDLALGSRAGLNPWQWTPATLGVVVPVGWTFRQRRLAAGLDGAVAGLFAAASSDQPRPNLAAQVRAHASYVHDMFTVGLQASAVWNGRHPSDRSQLAAGPLAKLPLCFGERRRPTCPLAAAAQLNLNLDAPYGFAGDGLDIWGMQFGLEWALYDGPAKRR